MLLWKPPVYQGRNPVNGFYIDIKEADAPEEAWRGVNTKASEKTYIKVIVRSQFLLDCDRHIWLQLLFHHCFFFMYRLRILRKVRSMCSECVLRTKPVLEKPQMLRSQSLLWPNQVGCDKWSSDMMYSAAVTLLQRSPLFVFRHQGDSSGCWWWWYHFPELWMWWLDPWLQICVGQELWGNHRHQPPDHRDQGQQVRD